MATKLIRLMVGGVLAMTLTYAPANSALERNDPPGRAARLSYVEGTVSLQPAGVEDWAQAELNRPLTTGDRLWIESGARAELQIGSAALRLNGRSNSTIINLDDHTLQVEISLGTLNVHLHDLGEGEVFEVDTPNLAFSLLRPGDYRVEVSEQGELTSLTVWGGEGEATASGQAVTVRPREQLRVSGNEQMSFVRGQAQTPDPFDEWCNDRDKRIEESLSARFVAEDVPGSEDLDNNGIWRAIQEFGQMWVPSGVPEGWAPYRTGHWVWIQPWGWTWVDDAPWGYAPYHYGRWAYVGGTWGWVPGPRVWRPIYSPALVVWRGGFEFSVGASPAVGWLPLAPGEVWVPGYHASRLYFERINRSNTIVNSVHITNVYTTTYLNNNVTNIKYVNQNVNGALTAMPHSAMASGQRVTSAVLHTSPSVLGSGQWRHTAPVVPQQEAVLGGRPKAYSTPPPSSMNRSFVAKSTPPPPAVPFSQQQRALQDNPGRPLDAHTMSNLQRSAPTSAVTYRPAMPTSEARNITAGSHGTSPEGTKGGKRTGQAGTYSKSSPITPTPQQQRTTQTQRATQKQQTAQAPRAASPPQQHTSPPPTHVSPPPKVYIPPPH